MRLLADVAAVPDGMCLAKGSEDGVTHLVGAGVRNHAVCIARVGHPREIEPGTKVRVCRACSGGAKDYVALSDKLWREQIEATGAPTRMVLRPGYCGATALWRVAERHVRGFWVTDIDEDRGELAVEIAVRWNAHEDLVATLRYVRDMLAEERKALAPEPCLLDAYLNRIAGALDRLDKDRDP